MSAVLSTRRLAGLISALRAITTADESHASEVIKSHARAALKLLNPLNAAAVLPARQLEVFRLIGTAKSRVEIAQELGLSPKTVDAHMQLIRGKLGLADGRELLMAAVKFVNGIESEVAK